MNSLDKYYAIADRFGTSEKNMQSRLPSFFYWKQLHYDIFLKIKGFYFDLKRSSALELKGIIDGTYNII